MNHNLKLFKDGVYFNNEPILRATIVGILCYYGYLMNQDVRRSGYMTVLNPCASDRIWYFYYYNQLMPYSNPGNALAICGGCKEKTCFAHEEYK